MSTFSALMEQYVVDAHQARYSRDHRASTRHSPHHLPLVNRSAQSVLSTYLSLHFPLSTIVPTAEHGPVSQDGGTSLQCPSGELGGSDWVISPSRASSS